MKAPTNRSRDTYLQLLSKFADSFSDRFDDNPALRTDDPDVLRIIESIALFSAHTQHTALDSMNKTVQALFRGPFEYLMAPEPGHAIVCAVPNARMTEPSTLPATTVFRIAASDGQAARFSQAQATDVFPISLRACEMKAGPDGSYRLRLEIQSRHPLSTAPDPLSIYVRHLGDHSATARVLQLIRHHLVNVSASYDRDISGWERGEPAKLQVGGKPPSKDRPAASHHPLEEVRSSLHFPQQHHFLHVSLPQPTSSWSRLVLCIDLDEHWPAELILNRASFHLHAVALDNRVSCRTTPTVFDGTAPSVPLLGSDDDASEPHTIVGVFVDNEGNPDSATPLLPAHLATGNESYELDYVHPTGGAGMIPELKPQLPNAFVEPRIVTTEAQWYHPNFSNSVHLAHSVQLHNRRLEGANWNIVGHVTGHSASDIANSPQAAMSLLALRTRDQLSLADVTNIMRVLGVSEHGPYADAHRWIRSFGAQREPHPGHVTDCVQYILTLNPIPDDETGLAEEYVRVVEQLLRAWSRFPIEFAIHRTNANKAKPMAHSEAMWA